MKCKEVKRHIHLYIDGELETEHRERFLAHLNQCVLCRIYLKRMEETRELMGAMIKVDAPASLNYLVRSKLGLDSSNIHHRWFLTLKFRLIEFSLFERIRAIFMAAPITAMLFIIAGLLVYSPESIKNMTLFLHSSVNGHMHSSLIERHYFENLYEFSAEMTSSEYVCSSDEMVLTSRSQPRISIASIRMFMENDFQDGDLNHLSVVANIRTDGSAEVESISEGDQVMKERIRNMLGTSIIFPALVNGESVESKVLFTFDKVEVIG